MLEFHLTIRTDDLKMLGEISRLIRSHYGASLGGSIESKSIQDIEDNARPDIDPPLDLAPERDFYECEYCGKEFRPKTYRSRFCSKKCAQAEGNLVKKERKWDG